LVQLLVVDLIGVGICHRVRRRELRQFRVRAVVVDRRLHRIAVVVVIGRE
jgi:hypothetical protein